jgi:hypothetical protein
MAPGSGKSAASVGTLTTLLVGNKTAGGTAGPGARAAVAHLGWQIRSGGLDLLTSPAAGVSSSPSSSIAMAPVIPCELSTIPLASRTLWADGRVSSLSCVQRMNRLMESLLQELIEVRLYGIVEAGVRGLEVAAECRGSIADAVRRRSVSQQAPTTPTTSHHLCFRGDCSTTIRHRPARKQAEMPARRLPNRLENLFCHVSKLINHTTKN